MKKIKNTQPEVKETKKDALRRLFLENNLVEEDVYKDKKGFVIITRTGIDKIVSKQRCTSLIWGEQPPAIPTTR